MLCQWVAVLFLGPLLAGDVSLHPFASRDTYGFMDDEGVVRIEPRYADAEDFAEGVAPVAARQKMYKNDSRGRRCFDWVYTWGFIDAAGRSVVPCRYVEVRSFSEGRAAVRSGDKWGFVDRAGREVVRSQFAESGDFHDGLAWIRSEKAGRAGYIDKSGKLVVSAAFRGAGDFQDGVAVVGYADGESYALIDRSGRVVTARRGWLSLLGEGRVVYGPSHGGPFGLMDTAGNPLTGPVFDAVSPFSESLASVRMDGRWGFIDRQGKVVIPIAFADPAARDEEYRFEAYTFHEGLASIYAHGRFGYIDPSGTIAIPPRYAASGPFSEGLAIVCPENRIPPASPYEKPGAQCGFIDKTGRFEIAPTFRWARSFHHGWAEAMEQAARPVDAAEIQESVAKAPIFVNHKGKIVRQPEWSESWILPGQCTYAPPAPPPRDYVVKVSVRSTPPGAAVYLVPLWDWQRHDDGNTLIADTTALAKYLVTKGTTPFDLDVKAQTYRVIFELAGKRKSAELYAMPSVQSEVSVRF